MKAHAFQRGLTDLQNSMKEINTLLPSNKMSELQQK